MKKILLGIFASLFMACSGNDVRELYFDGRLETDIIKITAQISGELDSVFIDEGEAVKKGQLLAIINSDPLKLQKKQQRAQLQEIASNFSGLDAQARQLTAQLKLNRDLISKTQNLLDSGAVSSQKLEDLKSQNDVLSAQQDAVTAQKSGLENKRNQINALIELCELNIKNCRLTAPLNGTILNRYFNMSEFVNPGKAVFELANLNIMEATIYVSLRRLANINLNQQVDVYVDGIDDNFPGKVHWIANEAEFTPKTILTEETRTSLVYAVKIQIDNSSGKLKIGMPVQVKIMLEQS